MDQGLAWGAGSSGRELARDCSLDYPLAMIIIRFPDDVTKRRTLEFLMGRFNGHTWASGEMAVPEDALAPLTREGIPFAVEGPITYERILSLRTSAAAAVQ